jgi:hypothetical protein
MLVLYNQKFQEAKITAAQSRSRNVPSKERIGYGTGGL